MRTLKKYVPKDDFDIPKSIDLSRFTAVLIRQSDERGKEEHAYSREAQLKLIQYAMRLRGDTTDEKIRVYDEGAGVSGQKHIHQRKVLNDLYNDMKRGIVGSLVIIHEDRLFRDQYHTNDTTFIKHLAENNVMLFVKIDHRRYDCTKTSDRNSLLDKLIASRNYLEEQVLGKMNGGQEAKALNGQFDGRNLAMGYIVKGKKKQQVILIYEPWAKVIRWMFARFKELDSIAKLAHEIELMPYLFKDPTADDFLEFTFKIRMTKVPGGFKPSCVEAIKYMLSNLMYAGAWIYNDAVVMWNDDMAIVDRELALWAYHKITGRDIEGNLLENVERRQIRDDGAEAVLKFLLQDPIGSIYVTHPEHPEYIRQTLIKDHKAEGKLFRDITFAIRAHLIDDIFLERVKEVARADKHLAKHIEACITELEEKYAESIVSVEDHLAQVRLQIEKTLALLHDQILTLDEKSKEKFNKDLLGLREREKKLLAEQGQATQTSLKADYEELSDVLQDIPRRLDTCTMQRKQKLARLITESVTIEEISVHWLRFTVVWRGPLANRPDVCLIWRQRGRRSDDWTNEEDEYIRTNYPEGDKWVMLEALPTRTWNMIYQRALTLGIHRKINTLNNIPQNVTMHDLNVIPDRETAIQLVTEASQRNNKSYGIWLFSAGLHEFTEQGEHWNTNIGSSPSPSPRGSSAGRPRANQASISP